MSEPARNRFALDLEDLERQLRAAGQTQRPAASPDPLAELTRIVGQDDPLKDIFAERRPQAVQPAMRQEPSLAVVPPRPAPVPAPVSEPPAELRGALDEFEALLRRTEPERRAAPAQAPDPAWPQQQAYRPHQAAAEDDDFPPALPAYAEPAYAQPAQGHGVAAARDLDEEQGFYQEPGHEPAMAPHGYAAAQPAYQPGYDEDDMPDLEPRRSRKGLWAAAAVIAIGVIGVGGTMLLRGGSASKDGQPPVIAADSGPVKVEPANPGGTEIPNQNKQIYERSAEAPQGQTKLVDNQEQPVDIQEAARTMPSRVVLAGPGTAEAGTVPAPAPDAAQRSIVMPEPALTPMPAVPGLGEPRKVRTVAIRPDGTPAQVAAAADANGSRPLATGSAPARSIAGSPGSMSLPPAAAAPQPAPKAQERATTPAATTPAAPMRLASAPPAAAPAPANSAIRAGTGDFVVQLGAPGSEQEAKATFAALQRKYPQQLGGQSPIIRRTELAGGKTVYRLRVGPYSREGATSMCSQLQAAGGQCFIAKN
ncbi:SPOR domain-containing protein [Bosea sp. (in: a-proteobacteria)]